MKIRKYKFVAFTATNRFQEDPKYIGTIDVGECNGYLGIPKGHPLFEIPYQDIEELMKIKVHYGLTYSGWATEWLPNYVPDEAKDMWIIGFDTCHHADTKEIQNKKFVLNELQKLIKQINKKYPNPLVTR